ncbi:type III-B CRISPR module RAMP protein Cmr4 [Caldisericum sp.]|jgi:CRISPR-associated protein Cmr4|uniref:type III-B CRISPR module RAMP protein Cmr4 n=1 Tax=Caldisericum sp. TaxID=2499687 RepID=UPI003D09D3AC
MSINKIFFLICETSVHAGASESVGYVDLPIQRNKVTKFPIIQASEVKGCLREYFEDQGNEINDLVEEAFGPDKKGDTFGGALSFIEAKVLFFPVKALYGVYAYITCPLVLNDFFRLASHAGYPVSLSNGDLLAGIGQDKAIFAADSINKVSEDLVIINDFPLKKYDEMTISVNLNGEKANIFNFFGDKIFPNNEEYAYWKSNFPKRAMIVSDSLFEIITNTSTEVVTRNRIDNITGTVNDKEGGLWNEENLPAETILYSMVQAEKARKEEGKLSEPEKLMDFLKGSQTTSPSKGINGKRLQIGGDKTVGKGFVFVNFFD